MAKGYTQICVLDYNDAFFRVSKMTIVQLFLAMATIIRLLERNQSISWIIKALDIVAKYFGPLSTRNYKFWKTRECSKYWALLTPK